MIPQVLKDTIDKIWNDWITTQQLPRKPLLPPFNQKFSLSDKINAGKYNEHKRMKAQSLRDAQNPQIPYLDTGDPCEILEKQINDEIAKL